MATVKRISDSYSIVSTGGNTIVSIGNVSTSPANLTINGNLAISGTVTGTSAYSKNAVIHGANYQTICTGNVQLSGNITGVSLPVTYPNTNYRIQVTYNATNFFLGNAGILSSNADSTIHFTIYSGNPNDTNYVFWTTYPSITT